MNLLQKLTESKRIITIILAAAGIVDMVFYARCDTSCSYLQGDIFGMDLRYIGIGYMLVIMLLSVFRQMAFVRILIACGIGVEIYLIAFQMVHAMYCPFCMLFAGIVIAAFALTYEKPLAVADSRLTQIAYAFGDADLSPIFKRRMPLLLFVFLGYLFILLTFSGSTTPAYGAEPDALPSYGSGPCEVIVATDYFCPPCRSLEAEMDPALDEFLSRKGIRVTFIDVPIHKQTFLYAKYFLYVAKANHKYKDILQARRVLFDIAKTQAISKEEELAKTLKSRGITFEPYDLKTVYQALNKMISTYKINSTPTCVVKYPNDDIRTYVGIFQIRNGLAMLRAWQKNSVKIKDR